MVSTRIRPRTSPSLPAEDGGGGGGGDDDDEEEKYDSHIENDHGRAKVGEESKQHRGDGGEDDGDDGDACDSVSRNVRVRHRLDVENPVVPSEGEEEDDDETKAVLVKAEEARAAKAGKAAADSLSPHSFDGGGPKIDAKGGSGSSSSGGVGKRKHQGMDDDKGDKGDDNDDDGSEGTEDGTLSDMGAAQLNGVISHQIRILTTELTDSTSRILALREESSRLESELAVCNSELQALRAERKANADVVSMMVDGQIRAMDDVVRDLSRASSSLNGSAMAEGTLGLDNGGVRVRGDAARLINSAIERLYILRTMLSSEAKRWTSGSCGEPPSNGGGAGRGGRGGEGRGAGRGRGRGRGRKRGASPCSYPLAADVVEPRRSTKHSQVASAAAKERMGMAMGIGEIAGLFGAPYGYGINNGVAPYAVPPQGSPWSPLVLQQQQQQQQMLMVQYHIQQQQQQQQQQLMLMHMIQQQQVEDYLSSARGKKAQEELARLASSMRGFELRRASAAAVKATASLAATQEAATASSKKSFNGGSPAGTATTTTTTTITAASAKAAEEMTGSEQWKAEKVDTPREEGAGSKKENLEEVIVADETDTGENDEKKANLLNDVGSRGEEKTGPVQNDKIGTERKIESDKVTTSAALIA